VRSGIRIRDPGRRNGERALSALIECRTNHALVEIDKSIARVPSGLDP